MTIAIFKSGTLEHVVLSTVKLHIILLPNEVNEEESHHFNFWNPSYLYRLTDIMV